MAERLKNYTQNHHGLAYIEEDKNEKDSWHRVSEVANLPNDSGLLKPDELSPCYKPPYLKDAHDGRINKSYEEQKSKKRGHKDSGDV